MKGTILVVNLFMLISSAMGQQTVRKFNRQELKEQGLLKAKEVYLSNIEFVHYKGSVAPGSLSKSDSWWSSRAGGWIGGIGGSIIGLSGAAIGILTGLGKARKLVMVLFAALFIAGIASLFIGISAVIMSQPYAVYYPLLLCGVIVTVVLGFNYRVLKRRYTELEIRKIRARDFGKD